MLGDRHHPLYDEACRSYRLSMGIDKSDESRDPSHRPSIGRTDAHGAAAELLPGTLDLIVLRTLLRGPMHGYGIAQRVKEISKDVLQVGESSLYPALQRLL